MSLEHLGYIDLPPHAKPGGFDHAAVHRATARVYVAHTANDALDVIDTVSDRYCHSISDLAGVAGALISDEHDLVFTSNRGENTVGIFTPGQEAGLVKVKVGVRPNGLAYAPGRRLLLAANVGDPAVPHSFTVSIVDVQKRALIADVAVPGRTRWTVYDAQTDAFYVNIAEPPKVAVIDAGDPTQLARTFDIPAAGPHGLDLDAERGHLFCACDGQELVVLDARSGNVLNGMAIGGVPDVVFFNEALRHLYVAIGNPGIIEVLDLDRMKLLETVPTEEGAHTMSFDAARDKIYAFLPQTHRAAIYSERDAGGDPS
jgi:DNA-binding beta-propeller fold protein YncE